MQVANLPDFLDIAEFALVGQEEFITFEVVRTYPSLDQSFEENSVAELELPQDLLTPCFYFIQGNDQFEELSDFDLECEGHITHLIIEEDIESSGESSEETPCLGEDMLDSLDRQYQKLLVRKVEEACHAESFSMSTSVSDDLETVRSRGWQSSKFQQNPGYCFQTRRDKVSRYIEKRQNRNWNKKISYKCRKEVADSRLRVKGRFVTRTQANKLLGINTTGLSISLIRTLLENKFGKEKDQGEEQKQVLLTH